MRRRLPLLLAALLTVALTACSLSGKAHVVNTDTGNDSGATTTTGKQAVSPSYTINWRTCGRNQCGTIQVPVDYSKPNGASLSLGLVDILARNQKNKVGPLLVNPGGPGASGIDLATSNPWDSAVRDNFDIIGFDPRGVGQSSKVSCGVSPEELYHVDYVPDTPAETQALVDVSKRYADDCEAKYPNLLPFLGTRDVARDMDAIRIGLGVDKISYLGYSYGTAIGQAYMAQFPTHVNRMVLDGIVDLNQSGIQGAQGQGIAFEKLLKDFESWCTSHSSCAARPDPAALVQRVYDKTQRGTIPAPEADRELGPGEFQLGTISPLYLGQQGYSQLADALADADNGDGSKMVDSADQYLSESSTEIYFAVSCLDQSWPRDPQAIIDGGKAIAGFAPILGEGTVTDYIRCAIWPATGQPLSTPTNADAPPTLVISTTDDPATPYQNGVNLAKLLPNAMLLTHNGSAHTIYGQGDSCVDNKVNAYLTKGTPITVGTTCN